MRSTTDAEALPRPAQPAYYGWAIVFAAAAAMVGTLPGRTQGLGLITEPLLRDLQLTRVAYAQINLAATLIGALFCFGIGTLLDRAGSRVVLTALALVLGMTVIGMSAAQGIVALAILITLTRGLGQSALSIVSLSMVGKWFRRRITQAMGVYAVAMSVGFMAAFPIVGAAVTEYGWRVAWSLVGVSLLVGLAPLAWMVVRATPESVGLTVDGDAPVASDTEGAPAASDATFGEALRSPAFWVFGLASAMYGLIASGIGLFNESILAERGFAPSVYHQALAVTAMTSLGGNFAAGAYAARRSLRTVLVAALAILAAGLLALPHITTITQVMGQAVAMGVGGGFVIVVFFSFWSRAYGRTHLGRIQGAAQALTVLASAIGPLALAYCVERTGSYAIAFYVLAALVLLLGVGAVVVPLPAGVRPRDPLPPQPPSTRASPPSLPSPPATR